MLPSWFWTVRYRTPAGGGETTVVAPHPAGAKQTIDREIHVLAFESVAAGDRVPEDVAAQRFGGYYPNVQSAVDAVRED